MAYKYILNGKTPVPVDDAIEWARWFGEANTDDKRRVARTTIDDTEVSTVFLGLDHGFGLSEGPLLFETMVFGGPLDQEQCRYGTWEDAENGHELMVQRVKAFLLPGLV